MLTNSVRETLMKNGLSNREAEVAALVATGMSNRDVADRLFVTEKTIKFHLTNIYKKMNIRSRAQLIVWCLPHLTFVEKSPASATPVNPTDTRIGSAAQPSNFNGGNGGYTAPSPASEGLPIGGGGRNNNGQAFGI